MDEQRIELKLEPTPISPTDRYVLVLSTDGVLSNAAYERLNTSGKDIANALNEWWKTGEKFFPRGIVLEQGLKIRFERIPIDEMQQVGAVQISGAPGQ